MCLCHKTHSVVEGHTVDDHEVFQVVFVWCVVPVPSHHIERREILRTEQAMKQIRHVCLSKHKRPYTEPLTWNKGIMKNVFVVFCCQREHFLT